jgi:hypothetical protein
MFRFAVPAVRCAGPALSRTTVGACRRPFLFRPLARMLAERPQYELSARIHSAFYVVFLAGVFLSSVSFLVKGTYNPFIYFNF